MIRYAMLIVSVLLSIQGVRGEVLFERELSEKEKARYETVVIDSSPDAMTPEEARARNWGKTWSNLKVELLKTEEANPKSFVRRTTRGRDLERPKAQAAWLEQANKRLAVAAGATFRCTLQNGWFLGEGVFVGASKVGKFGQEFKDGGERRVSSSLYEFMGEEKVPMREFLRRVVDGAYAMQASSIGPVAVWKYELGSTKCVAVVWVSRNVLVGVGGEGVTLDALLEQYGKQFPNTLPENIVIDPAAWARDEVDDSLARVKVGAVEVTGEQLTDPFLLYDNFARRYVDLPIPVNEVGEAETTAARRKLADKLDEWWKRTRAKTHWDPTQQKLVVDSPAKQDNTVKPPAKLDAAQIAEAKLRLVRTFEEAKAKQSASLAEAFEEIGNRVIWKKESETTWHHEYPDSDRAGTIVVTYTGPVFSTPESGEGLLRAKFNLVMKQPKREKTNLVEVYKFDGSQWVRTR